MRSFLIARVSLMYQAGLMSIRWTGLLRVPHTGVYNFSVAGYRYDVSCFSLSFVCGSSRVGVLWCCGCAFRPAHTPAVCLTLLCPSVFPWTG